MPVNDLLKRFEQIRKTTRLIFLVDGLLRALICLSVFAIVTFLIDWVIPDLPKGVRLFFLGSSVVLLAAIFYRYIFYPLSVKIRDEDIALCLERVYPDLDDRLISSVQLAPIVSGQARSDQGVGDFNSPQLIQALLDETVTLVRPLDFRKVINARVQKKLGVFALVVVCLIGTYATFYPAYTGIWFNRLLGGNRLWPKKTELRVAISKNPIAKGENVSVTVTATKKVPAKVHIYYEFDSAEQDYARMNKLKGRKFKFDFARVTDSFRFRVKGGDYLGDWHRVSALTPPRIDKIVLYYEYPEYTGLVNTDESKPVEGTHVKAPVGTKVKFVAESNIELDRVQLTLQYKGQTETKNLIPASDHVQKSRIIQSDFMVMGDGYYSFDLTAANGLKNISQIKYPIKAVVDNGPVIRIVDPTRDHKDVTPVATVPLAVVTTDDYGISQITFVHQLMVPEAQPVEKLPFTEAQNDGLYGQVRIESHHNLELAQWGVQEGQVIKFFLEAGDNYTVGQPHQSRSRIYRLTVISPDQMKKKIEEIEMRLKEEIKRIKILQSSTVRKTNDFVSLLARKDKLDPAEKRSLDNTASSQRRISQGVERVTREFDEVIKDITINKLWDQTTLNKLESINDVLKEVATVKSPAAGRELVQASHSPQAAQREEKLQLSRDQQNDIIQDLNDVLAKMEEWEDYQEVVRIVREMLQKQQRIIKELKE
ncbi:MAG: hypothetical protein KAS70_06425 [Planctomycetes bacterium]|nr:hypothetical protein [Planctomycetota bacterium]